MISINGFIARKKACMLMQRAYLRGQCDAVRKLLTRMYRYNGRIDKDYIERIAEEWEMVLNVYDYI